MDSGTIQKRIKDMMTSRKEIIQDKWNEWLTWHEDWKERKKEITKQIKRNYKGRERIEKLEQITKDFMNEFWATRQSILGH